MNRYIILEKDVNEEEQKEWDEYSQKGMLGNSPDLNPPSGKGTNKKVKVLITYSKKKPDNVIGKWKPPGKKKSRNYHATQ
jgi:hypothetical protein